MKPRPRPSHRPPAAASLALAIAAALVAGCSAPEEITTYETPRTQPRVVAVDAAEARAKLDHMFAAVIPAGDTAWFFKLLTPDAAAANAVRKPFEDFVATVDVGDMVDVDADKNADHPAWKLPDGWTEQPGGEMRAATIVIPRDDAPDDGELEITVSRLPLALEWPAFLQVNVTRWMGQLQQTPLSDSTIAKLKREVATVKGKATLFELVGEMKVDPMGAGLAGLPPGHPPATGRTPLSPPADAEEDADAAPAPAVGLTYKAPADWQALPLNTGMFPREASFAVTDSGGKADLAVTRFAAHGEMAALGPNVRRWAGQVGITSLTEDDVKNAAAVITVDGDKALQFEFFSPADAPVQQGLLAVMAERGEEVWFVKLFGDKATIENQRAAFEAFVKSIRFNAS